MAEPASGPLIVTADFDPPSFAWLDGLRRAHYPADRNRVSAHLTLFHHLPPSLLLELKERLRAECDAPAPPATAVGLARLGNGTAIRITSPALADIRARLADAFAPLLTPQDRSWWPHVTIQNKVTSQAADALYVALTRDFSPRPIGIAGLAVWVYRAGPWESLARYRFSRSARSRRS